MDIAEFINLVRERAGIATDTEAQTACCATLNVLTERIPEDKALGLADLVPAELVECLRQEQYAQQFDINEFYRRVGNREGVSPDVAVDHAQAVIDVLKQAVPADEIKGIISELPGEYSGLFRMPQVKTASQFG
jgi:uncharacterized protein (DUF2267 family)